MKYMYCNSRKINKEKFILHHNEMLIEASPERLDEDLEEEIQEFLNRRFPNNAILLSKNWWFDRNKNSWISQVEQIE